MKLNPKFLQDLHQIRATANADAEELRHEAAIHRDKQDPQTIIELLAAADALDGIAKACGDLPNHPVRVSVEQRKLVPLWQAA